LIHPGFLLLLFALKLLANSLTQGSGASGGIFSPYLFVGATLGGAYALLLAPLMLSVRCIHPPGRFPRRARLLGYFAPG
jgi:CIC family chloride channel protein